MSMLDTARETFRRDQVFDVVAPRQSFEGEIDTRHGPILYVEDVTVSFDGFKALDALTMYIDDGELRCIIGPNGAGKTTMMDVLTGRTRPDQGSVYFGSRIDLLRMDETEIANGGIGRKFQKPTVFYQHTVVENLELAMAGDRRVWPTLFARVDSRVRDRIAETLDTIGLASEARQPAGQLSHGQKQWLEIGMLLMQDPRVLLVDEPVAGMTHQEMDRTGKLLTDLAGRHSVLLVEHDMEFVRSLARQVTVLHQGSVLAEGTMDEVQNDPKVVEVYLGE
jgi:urea transport system ATP-binding protein